MAELYDHEFLSTEFPQDDVLLALRWSRFRVRVRFRFDSSPIISVLKDPWPYNTTLRHRQGHRQPPSGTHHIPRDIL